MGILVLTTGGTIGAMAYPDPQNPPDISIMPPTGVDLVKTALSEPAFAFAATRCITLESRDSKLIDEAYRLNILRLVHDAPETEILITHGTDRLLESADFFYHFLREQGASFRNKTILLTGAMTPLENGSTSDGYQNLTFALKQLMALASGASENNGAIFIVLCDYDVPETEGGAWQPRLYRYRPHAFIKFYAADGRYNRLKRVTTHDQD